MKNIYTILILAVSLICIAGCSCGGGNKLPEVRVEKPEKAHRIANINFKKEFNDLNEKHLAVAKNIGVNATDVDSVEGSEVVDKLVFI